MYKRFLGALCLCVVAGSLAPAQQSKAGSSPYPTTAATMNLPASAGRQPISKLVSDAPAAPTTSVPNMAMTPSNYMPPGMVADPAGVCASGTCEPLQNCAACDCLCGPPGRFWVSGEWLYWRTKGQYLPPLVTQSPAGTPQDRSGVIGTPGTNVLYGGESRNQDWRNGFRLNAGLWLDECQRFGIAGDYFFLEPSTQTFAISSPGQLLTSRPFINAANNLNDAQLVSFPNVLSGTVAVRNRSQFNGAGVNFINNLCCDPCGRIDFFTGYRYLSLRDEVQINEDLTSLGGSNIVPGTRFQIQDRFRTTNDFHGVNFGFSLERRFSHYFFGLRTGIALGVTNTVVEIDGSTVITPPGGPSQTFAGGLLTQPSNIGRYSSDTFSVVPEIGVRFGVQVTDHLRAFASYNFLYWSDVARAGEQIDLRVNTNQIAPPQPLNGPALPAYVLQRSGFWVHGVGLGLEYRY